MKLRTLCFGLLIGATGIGCVAIVEHQLGTYSAQNLGRISQPAKLELSDDGLYGAAEGGSPPGSGLGRTGFPVAAGAALFSGLIV